MNSLMILLFLFMALTNKGDFSTILSNPQNLVGLMDVFNQKGDVTSLLTNPQIIQMVSGLFNSPTPSTPQEKPSKEAKEFFTPCKKVAGEEVYTKLCTFYDDWYVKH